MEYLKIEGEFPKLANCAVTMGNLTGFTVATGSWLRRSGSGRQDKIIAMQTADVMMKFFMAVILYLKI